MDTLKKEDRDLEGVLVVDKPSGMTSHDVVARVRRQLKMKRVGHAGTLDPLATGVLIILLGKSTKLFAKFEAFDKAYRATLLLGTRTTTADIQGKVLAQNPFMQVTREDFVKALGNFTGDIEQTPPMVSAVKFKGRRLYELARQGIEVERPARRIRISKLELKDFSPPYVKIYLECSKGTYVRKIAEDLGAFLGCGACITEIERTKVGPFEIAQSIALDAVHVSHIQPWTIKA